MPAPARVGLHYVGLHAFALSPVKKLFRLSEQFLERGIEQERAVIRLKVFVKLHAQ